MKRKQASPPRQRWLLLFSFGTLKDEKVSHGEMEGLAPDRAGHSG
jgi:hypothetical protein